MEPKTVINFGAGPAKIPEPVMKKAQEEFLVYPGTGISILEMSHRSSDFLNIYNTTVKLFREVMSIPNEYEVLFMHGGATAQFAAIPLNLKTSGKTADYAVTGRWSLMAAKEAQKYIDVNKVFSVKEPFISIPPNSGWKKDSTAAYLYYCANETVDGVEFKTTPETLPSIPLVADISSNVLSRPFNFTNHGIVFFSTQKNLGAAGLAVVIVRRDLIRNNHTVPSVLSYYETEKSKSAYNTPNVFAIYLTKLILEWIRDCGGVEEIYRTNQEKAMSIYNLIDDSNEFYNSPVDPYFRSLTNIPFRIGCKEGEQELEDKFLADATQKGMIGLKGHRSVGGVRVSLYNAITAEETSILRQYMEEFMEEMSPIFV